MSADPAAGGGRRVLLVEPSYKPNWEIPGGAVEADEPPWETATRELADRITVALQAVEQGVTALCTTAVGSPDPLLTAGVAAAGRGCGTGRENAGWCLPAVR